MTVERHKHRRAGLGVQAAVSAAGVPYRLSGAETVPGISCSR